MIVFVAGTTAELIKIAPVAHELRSRGRAYELWFTGMHMKAVQAMLASLDLAAPEVWLARGADGRDVTAVRDVPGWAGTVLLTSVRMRRQLRARLRVDGPGVILVHGDTFSTVLGAILGRVLRTPVGHIEAGLRSGSLRSPFPEELNRRIVAHLANVHFAPTEREVTNLARAGGDVVCTGANTVVDILRSNLAGPVARPAWLPARYGVATLHRFELVRDAAAYRGVIAALLDASRRIPLVLLLGESDRRRMAELGMSTSFPSSVVLAPKMPYTAFTHLVAGAEFVITDSGGLQEECAYLGVPCLVHRTHTERFQGIGANVLLSGMRVAEIGPFVTGAASYRRPASVDEHRPSRVIADMLDVMAGRLGESAAAARDGARR